MAARCATAPCSRTPSPKNSEMEKQDTTAALPALTLRAPEPSDIDFIYRWENDPALWHNSLTPPLTSRQQIWEYVHSFTGDIPAAK